MSIEINGSGNRPPVVTTGDAQQTNASGAASSDNGSATSAARPTADTFSMTGKAAQLQQLEAQISSLPVVDTQRVGEVQHALATNTMEVNPARVADKMLNFEAGLDPKG